MGLDMYAYTANADLVGDDRLNPKLSDPTTGKHRDDVDADFAYWRKFNHLHGWMERLYRSLGGEGPFNCDPIRLLESDIDQLEADLNATLSGERDALPATEGCFFGGRKSTKKTLRACASSSRNRVKRWPMDWL